MSKYYRILCVCLGLLIPKLGLANDGTLATYLQKVLDHNPSLASEKNRSDAAHATAQIARALSDPMLEIGLENLPVSGEDMGSMRIYQLTQNFPFPGKRKRRIEIAKKQAEISMNNVQTTERELKVIATQVFYRTLYNQHMLNLNKELLDILRTQIASVSQQYRLGDDAHHDLLLLKVNLGTLEVELARAKREQRSLQALFNELKHADPAEEVPLLKFEERPFKSQDSESLLLYQPELLATSALTKISELEASLARYNYFPDLMLQAMYMEPHGAMMDEKPTWGFMIGFNLPLYFASKQSQQVRASQALAQASQRDYEALMNRLRTEVIDAREQLRSAEDIVQLYQNVVLPDTKLALESARVAYTVRRLPLRDFLDLLRSHRVQQLEMIAAQIDVELGKMRLQELLSSPPILRLAPAKPSLFAPGGMGDAMGMDGMSSPSMAPGMGRGMMGGSSEMGPGPGRASGMEGM